MPKTAPGSKKKINVAKPAVAAKGPRILKAPKRQWNKPKTWFVSRPKPVYPPIAKSRLLLIQSLRNSWSIKKTVGGITFVYGLGIVFFVRGFSSSQDFVTIKKTLDGLLTGAGGKVESTLLQITALFGTNGSVNAANGSLYQGIVLVLCSLAIIWVFRQRQAKHAVSVKAAFYQGMYPLIPFLLVLCVISIQLLPLLGASYVYKALITNGVAVFGWEKLLAYTISLSLAYWSLRMLTSSIFAIYIVTLPGMTPLRALRSAKNLVRSRRLLIWRKFMLLPVVLFLASSLIILPFLLFLTPVVAWVFFVLSIFWFAIGHGYMYALYRELIKDA